jgi:hypothetical protein
MMAAFKFSPAKRLPLLSALNLSKCKATASTVLASNAREKLLRALIFIDLVKLVDRLAKPTDDHLSATA